MISVSSDAQVAASAPPARSKAGETRTSTAAPDFGSLVDDNANNTPPGPPADSAGADTHLSARPAAKSASSAARPSGRSQAGEEPTTTGPQSQGNDQAAPGGEDPAKGSRTGVVAAKPRLNGSGIEVSDPTATDQTVSDGSPSAPVTTQLMPVAVLVAVAPAANQAGAETSGSQAEGTTPAGGSLSQLRALAALQDAKAAGQKDAAGTSDGANPEAAANGTTTAQAGGTEQSAALTADAKTSKSGGAKKDATGPTLVQTDLTAQPATSGSGGNAPTQAGPTAPAGGGEAPAKTAAAEAIVTKDGNGKTTEDAGRDAAPADAPPLASLAHRLHADLSASLPSAGPHAAGAGQGTTAAAPSGAAPAPQAPAVPVSGLAVEISTQAQSGRNRFEIRLDPPELGRIDVRLDVDKASGQVTSHLTVDKPETLDLLRREAPQLQRALEDAGLKTGDGGLQFSLRDQSSFAGQRDDGQSGRQAQRLIIPDEDTVPAEVAGRSYGRMLGASRGVDIRV